MDYIAKIKRLAQKANSLGVLSYRDPTKSGRIFGEPVSMERIREFEKELNLTLPKPLVRYYTELGNSGAGADYGIYSLDKIWKSVTRNNLPPMLDHSLSNEQWTEISEKYTEIEERLFAAEDESEQNGLLKQLNQLEQQITAGGIPISTPGCTMFSVLMCRGAAKGEVFCLDWDYMDRIQSEPYCCGRFEDWIINDLQQRIDKAKV